MGSDRGYAERVARCLKPGEDPVGYNTRYADAHNYSLRFYVDEDVPFVAKHGKNALMVSVPVTTHLSIFLLRRLLAIQFICLDFLSSSFSSLPPFKHAHITLYSRARPS